MAEVSRESIIGWLKTKTKKDIQFTKNDPEKDIFLAHPGMTLCDAEILIKNPEKIISVERSIAFDDRLIIISVFSKKYDITYIILDPFNPNLEIKFKDKVAFVTFYMSKHKK